MSDDAASQPFVLTPEQRSKLVPNIDVDALQRFLQIAAHNAEEREGLLRLFSQREGNRAFYVVRTPNGDPAINALLDEIWAPTWEAWGPDAIARSDADPDSDAMLPGREIARARLGLKLPRSTK